MQTVILLLVVLSVSCNSSVSSSPSTQGPVNDFPKPAATQEIPKPSPSPRVKAQTEFRFDSHVGAAEMTSKIEMCLIVPNENLAEGDNVSVIFADERKSQSFVRAIVERKLNKCGRKDHDVLSKVSYYTLRVVDGSYDFESEYQELNPVAIAIVDRSQSVNLKSGVASADLDGDGQAEYFRACTSDEGIHLTVWSGRPLKGKRQWHWYVALHFATVPSCTTKDYKD